MATTTTTTNIDWNGITTGTYASVGTISDGTIITNGTDELYTAPELQESKDPLQAAIDREVRRLKG